MTRKQLPNLHQWFLSCKVWMPWTGMLLNYNAKLHYAVINDTGFTKHWLDIQNTEHATMKNKITFWYTLTTSITSHYKA